MGLRKACPHGWKTRLLLERAFGSKRQSKLGQQFESIGDGESLPASPSIAAVMEWNMSRVFKDIRKDWSKPPPSEWNHNGKT